MTSFEMKFTSKSLSKKDIFLLEFLDTARSATFAGIVYNKD